MIPFRIKSDFLPRGDQPEAIKGLSESLRKNNRFQTLIGVTGSGKTFTMAKIIEEMQAPALIISHNKTLAAQLFREFRTFFPDNAVEYFVSYYDYYQPESYVPHKDLYIEKDSSINDEIDRMRLKTTTSIIERKDVIVVASVSCIYGLGSPEDYQGQTVVLETGKEYVLDEILSRLVSIQYQRNNTEFSQGIFRTRGEFLDVFPAYGDDPVRVEFFDRTIEKITRFDALTGETKEVLNRTIIYPAKHFVTPKDNLVRAIEDIKKELDEQEKLFKEQGKLVEAQRIRSRTNYDIEMMLEMGYTSGIENYSRHLSRRQPGTAGDTLLSYFPGDFLTFIDESHVTIPQLKGMFRGDQARKKNLIDFGFRLPSAYDNRPLFFEEFLEKTHRLVFVSATPADFELEKSTVKVEQLIRPTGLIDPEIIIRPVANQIDDLLNEIKETNKRHERTLVTTLTKKMAEDLTEYLVQKGIKAKYLHSEVETLERVEIIRDLRKGIFDCLVGVNLLREGLDLPEVSCVAILDADKEGFLRSHTSLIQTSGRAARNLNGRVIMYADTITDSIKKTIEVTNHRREKQTKYNTEQGITPQTIKKDIVDIIERQRDETLDEIGETVVEIRRKLEKKMNLTDKEIRSGFREELRRKMQEYADKMEFEKAAYLRDMLKEI